MLLKTIVKTNSKNIVTYQKFIKFKIFFYK